MKFYESAKERHLRNHKKFIYDIDELKKKLDLEHKSTEEGNPIKYKSTLVEAANLISVSSLRLIRKMIEDLKGDESARDRAIHLIVTWIMNFKEYPVDFVQNWYTGNAGSIMDQLLISRFGDVSRDKETFRVPKKTKKMIFYFDDFLESMSTKFDNFVARQFNPDVKKYEVIRVFDKYERSLSEIGISGMGPVIDDAKRIIMEDKGTGSETDMEVDDTGGSQINDHIINNRKFARNYIKMAEVEARSISHIVEMKLSELESKI